ncbi:D-alanine--D-alanine ligase [Paenibacillus sp. FSL R7-0048]|jgi:D-alanine-D-alanine ligase|uniref:D-alanine--D-alanine ligase n=1 Tax=Paenibacillus TaxID=44249 RepID=UPI00096E664B|nr:MULTISPECIES: D-alanine--D-alanine ligase [Paenibacillus]MDH6429146.1 D-alanine-D-alanine ligase [Paenibacillus sp. PastH-4]MDH6445353.1 D-alanine-D-alanine ligase [Paenibacillus sp. PastF-4]MDH6529241.1 D-alanine-D-alanine ligase [Paenibacillus sp. PastH-3]OMC64750.1 D-alanine--D-alanine ligase A [Paenibacillus odorifer]OMD56143.1 D-alanine--D-alanine ligase A [Paenibacillus odorifer]
MGNAKLTVGLVYGGKSGEHEVSLQTAFAVMNSFDYDKYEIIPFYISKQGLWKVGEKLSAPYSQVEQLKLAEATEDMGTALNVVFSGLSGADQTVDVMFPLLHGTYGEDGTIQGLFEMANIPYIGAGVLASSAGMDKVVMKKLFADAGLDQCEFCYFNISAWKRKRHELIVGVEDKLGYPVFVKPANLGSSVGISKAADKDSLVKAIDFAFRYDTKVIIEEFVDAREVEVGVLGNDEPEASVPGEIVSSGEYYDYAAKYTDGKSQMMIPAPVDSEVADRLRESAIVAFRAIEGSGITRADFFLRKSDGKILINEVNTMPGFTPYSMYPLLWRETGVSYRALLDRMIELALERYNFKQGLKYDNE